MDAEGVVLRGDAVEEGVAACSRGAPQLPQNRSPGSFCVLQAAQVIASSAPHWPQNLRSGLFSWLQDGQFMMARPQRQVEDKPIFC